MSSQIDAIVDALCSALKPPPAITVSQWADDHRQLSPEASSKRGQWTTFPYQREPMDCLSPSHPCDRVVMKVASQTQKTETGLNFLGYIITHDPGPMLIVEPRIEDAKSLSKDRVTPMLRDTPILHGCIQPGRTRDSGDAMLHKVFFGGHVTFVGAISPSGLAMRPIRYLFLDEVDRYPAAVGKGGSEGDPVALAIRRTDTFEWNRKILIASTPTVKGASRIDDVHQLSDQREYFVPCPFCEYRQLLVFGERGSGPGLKWPEGHPEQAAYRCASCNELIPHYKKGWMMEHGEWVAQNPSSNIPGFHLNQLYSMLKSWETIARDFIEASKNVATLRTFVNTVLAELWEEKHEVKIDSHALMNRCEVYSSEPLPPGIALITAGVDVQGNRIEVEIVGWGYGEESWSLAHHEILGNPMALDVWNQLDVILRTPFETAEGIPMLIRSCCIDTGGHCSDAVYRFTRERFNRRVYAIKGRSDGNRPVWPKRPSRSKKDSSPLFIIGVDTAKDVIYSRLKVTNIGPQYMHFPMGRSQDYFDQLTSERVITRYSRGFAQRVWHKDDGQANEVLDTWVYAYAALESIKAAGLNLNREVNRMLALAATRRKLLEDAQAAGTPPPEIASVQAPQRQVSHSQFVGSQSGEQAPRRGYMTSQSKFVGG